TGWNDWNATTMMLPYMEQGQIYNAINFANSGDAADPGYRPNTTAFRIKINTLLCPSDPDRLTNVYGHSNYYGNSGNTPESIFDNNKHGASNGLFASVNNVRPVGFRDITDGLSQTAAFSERVKGLGSSITGYEPV